MFLRIIKRKRQVCLDEEKGRIVVLIKEKRGGEECGGDGESKN